MRLSCLLVFAIVLIGSISTPSREIYACSCAAITVQDAFDHASSIFSGRVTNIVDGRPANAQVFSSTDPLYVFFETSEIWKGGLYTSMVISTPVSGASCGYTFEIGEEYLVYTYTDTNIQAASLCSRTALIRDAGEDLSILGRGAEPKEPLPANVLVIVPTTTVLLATSTPLPLKYPDPTNHEAVFSSNAYPISSHRSAILLTLVLLAGVVISIEIMRRYK